ncbi:MAG TPA: DNA-processing protein DprA [Thermoplasmata archaeon]|nr:DNA-processing protein DprA [Thermoplasmata archaeon]
MRTVTPQELLGPLTALEAKYAPPRLYLAGKFRLPLLHPRVAIVGTREPSEEGRKAATTISRTLAESGVTIVSGLARGVDTAVHTAAIQAAGYTIAVLGTPLSRVNPPSNSDLQQRIMVDHLAVTQFSDQDAVFPANFVIRNRTMALIADASVIIESGDTGGSLSQGWETLRLGRPLFVHDREFMKTSITWPEKMARYGAIRFKEPSDIIDLLPSAIPSPEAAILALEAA